MLLLSSVSLSGVKVPVQMVLLSLAWLELIELLSDPLSLVMSALEKYGLAAFVCDLVHSLLLTQTGSENSSVTVALSPIFNSVSDIVKLSTEGAVVSTLTLELSGTALCVRLSGMLPAGSLIVLLLLSQRALAPMLMPWGSFSPDVQVAWIM